MGLHLVGQTKFFNEILIYFKHYLTTEIFKMQKEWMLLLEFFVLFNEMAFDKVVQNAIEHLSSFKSVIHCMDIAVLPGSSFH